MTLRTTPASLHCRLVGVVGRLPRRTIRFRLTLLYGGLFVLLGAGLLGATYLLVQRATTTTLTTRAGNVSSGIMVTTGRGAGGGGRTQASHQLRIVSEHAAGSGAAFGSSAVRHLTAAQLRQQAKTLIAQATAQHHNEMHNLLVYAGLALALMAVVAFGLGWFVAGRVLRPLRTMTAAVRHISASSLHERLELDGPDDELKELGETFDKLLGRLERSFQAQRQFVANASHELRTPLARQKVLSQVALADGGASIASLRAAHERVLACGEHQERLIEALLALSRGQAGTECRDAVDLAAVAELVVLAREQEANARRIDVRVQAEPATLVGDGRLVERLVSNVIDNAIRHNVEGGSVTVRTRDAGEWASVVVANTGPTVPDGDVERLFQPFERLDEERTGDGTGLGLGLSIVRAIAEAHGAEVVARPRPGGGLEVEVAFPREPVPPVTDEATVADDLRVLSATAG